MHVAYSMIHPEKYTCHKEFRDFWVRDKVCRAVEREFGLTVDNGIEINSSEQTRQCRNEKARLVETHTGQQSFDSYAQEHREAILRSLEATASWRELHASLAEYGMEIKPHGNGLIVKDRHSNRSAHAIKASALDRSLSLKKLEARFGLYTPPQDMEHTQDQARYAAAPLHRSPERGRLFTEYKAGIEVRKTTLQKTKEQEDATLAAIRAEWADKRRELERKNIAKKNLRRLLQLARKHEAEALARARLVFEEPRNALRREVPFTSWNGFLQMKAEQGSEIALAVLRSRQEAVEPEQALPAKDWSRHGQARVEVAARERAVLEMDGISGGGKSRLQSVLRMEQIAVDFRQYVDRKGAVVFTFQDGTSIRDSGIDILFSAGSEPARQLALLYAQKKWGKGIQLEGNGISRPLKEVTREKNREMGR